MKNIKNLINSIVELVERKNEDYGNSYDILRNEYGEVAFLIRLSDKVERLKSIYKNGKINVNNESEIDTIKDIIGYCLLELNYRFCNGQISYKDTDIMDNYEDMYSSENDAL